jgi:hypothetical protein
MTTPELIRARQAEVPGLPFCDLARSKPVAPQGHAGPNGRGLVSGGDRRRHRASPRPTRDHRPFRASLRHRRTSATFRRRSFARHRSTRGFAAPTGNPESEPRTKMNATGPSRSVMGPSRSATGPSSSATGPSSSVTGPSRFATGPNTGATKQRCGTTGSASVARPPNGAPDLPTNSTLGLPHRHGSPTLPSGSRRATPDPSRRHESPEPPPGSRRATPDPSRPRGYPEPPLASRHATPDPSRCRENPDTAPGSRKKSTPTLLLPGSRT